MEAQDLQDMVAEILEAKPEDLQEWRELECFSAYDSVARLSLMVGLSDYIGRPVTVAEIMELHTYGDVMKLARIGSTDANNG